MSPETFWTGKLVLVTGGASFIGSSLVDQLLARGAKACVVDDLTSGRLENLREHLGNNTLEFFRADLREPGVAPAAMQGVDTVFHLAADHGGRGYVDLHQAGPASNFFFDGLVFAGALKAKVKKVGFASSGCENRSEEHTSELQSLAYLVCRLLLEKKKKKHITRYV